MLKAHRLGAAVIGAALLALPAAALAAPQWRLTASTDTMADLVDQGSIQALPGWKSAVVLRVQKEPIITGATHVLFIEYFDCKGWKVAIKQIDAYNGANVIANVTNGDNELTWKPMQQGTFVEGDAKAICNNTWPDATVLSQDHALVGDFLFKKLNE